ncbi:unnamed protein product [Amoebophrya sp. A120]|nr:unnamed protein product [Amoebophrya sp. A120]|eukprot:GSA120T00018125001.1
MAPILSPQTPHGFCSVALLLRGVLLLLPRTVLAEAVIAVPEKEELHRANQAAPPAVRPGGISVGDAREFFQTDLKSLVSFRVLPKPGRSSPSQVVRTSERGPEEPQEDDDVVKRGLRKKVEILDFYPIRSDKQFNDTLDFAAKLIYFENRYGGVTGVLRTDVEDEDLRLVKNDQGGDRMSRSLTLTLNPHAWFSHSYAFGYTVHLQRWVRRWVATAVKAYKVDNLKSAGAEDSSTETRSSSRRSTTSSTQSKTQEREAMKAFLHDHKDAMSFAMAEVGILSGTGLALWHTVWNEMLLPKLEEGILAESEKSVSISNDGAEVLEATTGSESEEATTVVADVQQVVRADDAVQLQEAETPSNKNSNNFQLFGFDLDPTVYAQNAANLVQRGAFQLGEGLRTQLQKPTGTKAQQGKDQDHSVSSSAGRGESQSGVHPAPSTSSARTSTQFLILPYVYKFVQGLSVWLNRQRVRNSIRHAKMSVKSRMLLNKSGAGQNYREDDGATFPPSNLGGTSSMVRTTAPTAISSAPDPINFFDMKNIDAPFDGDGGTSATDGSPLEGAGPGRAGAVATSIDVEPEVEAQDKEPRVQNKERVSASPAARPQLSANTTFHLLIDDAYHSDESILHTFEVFHPFLQRPWTFFIEDNCGAVYPLADRLFDKARPYDGQDTVELFDTRSAMKTAARNDDAWKVRCS